MTTLQILLLVFAVFQHQVAEAEPSTEAPKPPGPQNVTVTLVRSNSVWLKWEQPTEWMDEGVGYVISTNGDPVTLQGVNNTFYKSAHLNPSTKYTYDLVAVSQTSEGSQVTSDPVTLVVLTNSFDEPSEPRNFRILYQRSDHVLLGWMAPKTWNAENGGYIIITTDDQGNSNLVRVGKSVNRFNSTGIQMGQVYTFQISAYNQQDGEEKISVSQTLQFLKRPEKPTNLKIGLITATTIDVSWDKPVDEEVDGYNVFHLANNIRTDRIQQSTSFVIRNLTPWTNCFINVNSYKEVKGQRVTSENITTYRTTDFAAPSVPERLTIADNTGTEVTLKWQAPLVPNGPLTGYVVSWTQDNKTLEEKIKQTEMTIKDLKPWTASRFSVSAYNSMKERTVQGQPQTINTNTSVAAPGPVDPFTVGYVTSTMMVIQWERPAETNGPLDGYLITATDMDGQQNYTSNTTDTIHKFDDLQPWTEYDVSISAYNLLDGEPVYGPPATNLTMTAAGAPGPCTDFTVTGVTNSSVDVTWIEPEVTNGPLEGYLLIVDHFIQGIRINPNMSSWTVNDLDPWTDVSLNISAFNYNEDGGMVLGPAVHILVKTDTSAPPDATDILRVSETDEDQAYLNIPVDIFSSKNGPIVEHILLVTSNKNEDMEPKRGFESVNETEFPSWEKAKNQGVWYRSSPENWNFNTDKVICSAPNNSTRKCVIGQQKTCDKVKFCDGPLNSKQEYWAKIRAYTDSGFAETFPVYFKTGGSMKLSSGIVCLIMYPLFKFLL